MLLLSIGYTSGKCDIYEKLNELSAGFKEKGINIGFMESDSGEMHFIKCMIRDEDASIYSLDEIRKSFNVYAANILYQAIADNFQIDIINRIVKSNYYYFKNDEIQDIIKRCSNILSGDSLTSNEDYMLHMDRKNLIVNKLYEYMSENTDIILDGFLRFRLKEFNSELEDMVDKVVEEYLIEREYNEFIKLLRYFVEVQESKIEIVNIVVNGDGSYCMYDDRFIELSGDSLRELIGEGLDGEQSVDDLLVSSLITMAPRYIILHNIENIRNKEIVETIKNVFSERVKTCTGCDQCVKKSTLTRTGPYVK